MRSLKILLVVLLVYCLWGCGADEGSQDGDSDKIDGDEDFDAWWEQDTDGDAFIPCQPGGCDGGRICNTETGLCEDCIKDIDCGLPDPETGITPVCLEGVCTDLICRAITEVQEVPLGAQLPVTQLEPVIDSDKNLVVEGNQVFPIGISGLSESPEAYLSEAKDNGFNLVLHEGGCCSVTGELDSQKSFLESVHNPVDLFAAVRAIWPPEQIEGDNQVGLRDSIIERSNSSALLMWMIDNPSFENKLDWIGPLYDYIKKVDSGHLVALADHSGVDYSAYFDKSDVIIHTLEFPASGEDFTYIASKIEELSSNPAAPPVWARIPLVPQSAIDCLESGNCDGEQGTPPSLEDIKLASYTALAAGAKGLIFWAYKLGDYSIGYDGWRDIKSFASQLHKRTLLWLSPDEDDMVTLEQNGNAVKLLTKDYSKTFIAYLINTSNQSQSVKLKVKPEKAPYCLGLEGEDQLMHLERELEVDIELAAFEIKVYQVSESSEPGGEE